MAKLVEILARELKEWPRIGYMDVRDGYEPTAAVSQDWDGELNSLGDGEPARLDDFNGKEWSSEHWELTNIFLEVSDDYPNAIVTRAEWQAAVDALKAKEAVERDGVGLPPVGAVVRGAAVGNPFFEAFRDMDLQVVFHDHNQDGSPIAVFRYPDPEESREVEDNGEGYASWLYHGMVGGMFRPIRTPKQIAADERRKGIADIAEDLGNRTWGVTIQEWLYDLGYRKQEQK